MPSTEPPTSTLQVEPTGLMARTRGASAQSPGGVVTSTTPVSQRLMSGARRSPSAVQTAHFKAFWVKPVEGKSCEPDLVQTVIPKRLLKKAVDRNGLRRVLREAVRESVRLRALADTRQPTPRVVLTSARGFKEQASRHALKGAWRVELDQLLSLLSLRLKV
jgi:RNase P protein component